MLFDVRGLDHKTLNQKVRSSDTDVTISECCGQRFIAAGMKDKHITINGIPGNALGAYLDGATVEEMYRNGWVSSIGGLFQYGRKYMYTPWQGYNPSNNLGNQTADIPWQNDTHMPCPEGYRVPTRSELNSLLPKNQEIPGTYIAGNGEKITATLHVGEGTLTTPTGVTGTQHYVKFTSEDTGRYLIIPLAGGKGDKSTTNNPSFGKRAVLWTSERNGCPGGYAWTYWLPFEGKETTAIAERQLQMEAFASLRCVKK